MSISTQPQSKRFGRVMKFRRENCPAVIYKMGFSKDYSDQPLFENNIIEFFQGIVRTATIIEWGFISEKADPMNKSLKSPVIFGECSAKFLENKIVINLKYYLDYYNLSKRTHNDISFYLQKGIKVIKKRMGVDINVINFNYYNILIAPIFYIKRKRNLRKKITQVTDYDFLRDRSVIIRYSKVYNLFCNVFKRYKKNRYFFRIINIVFSLFTFKNLDFKLLVNAATFEISNLRKQQNKFIRFVFDVLKYSFNKFSKSFGLKGIKFQFKGRIIPYNREHPRSILKVMRIGSLNANDCDRIVNSISTNPSTRFGAVNIKLTYNVKKKIFKGFFNPTTSFFKTFELTNEGYFKNSVFFDFFFFKKINKKNSLFFLMINFYKNIFFSYFFKTKKTKIDYFFKNLVLFNNFLFKNFIFKKNEFNYRNKKNFIFKKKKDLGLFVLSKLKIFILFFLSNKIIDKKKFYLIKRILFVWFLSNMYKKRSLSIKFLNLTNNRLNIVISNKSEINVFKNKRNFKTIKYKTLSSFLFYSFFKYWVSIYKVFFKKFNFFYLFLSKLKNLDHLVICNEVETNVFFSEIVKKKININPMYEDDYKYVYNEKFGLGGLITNVEFLNVDSEMRSKRLGPFFKDLIKKNYIKKYKKRRLVIK